jgi:hypothetical protein
MRVLSLMALAALAAFQVQLLQAQQDRRRLPALNERAQVRVVRVLAVPGDNRVPQVQQARTVRLCLRNWDN